jgi:hypothetical protein
MRQLHPEGSARPAGPRHSLAQRGGCAGHVPPATRALTRCAGLAAARLAASTCRCRCMRVVSVGGTEACGRQARRRALRGPIGCKVTTAATAPATSALGLGSPLPHLHWDWARPCHICTGTGLAPATSALGLGSPPPRTSARFERRLHRGRMWQRLTRTGGGRGHNAGAWDFTNGDAVSTLKTRALHCIACADVGTAGSSADVGVC